MEGLKGIVTSKESTDKPAEPIKLSSVQEEMITQIENKANRAGFETTIRLIAAAPDKLTAQAHLKALMNSFFAVWSNGAKSV